MKKNFFIIAAVVCGMSCTTTAYAQFKIGGKKINVTKAVQAGTDAIKAISLSDADIAAMSKEYMEWMDTHNPADETRYGLRQAFGEADRKYQGSGRLEGKLRCLRSDRCECLCVW